MLKEMYPKMVIVTCLSHALHLVAKKIWANFPSVDLLIANLNKTFSKPSTRIQKFKDILPNVPLPPKPVITRWGTWLNAAIYCSEYHNSLLTVFNQLNAEDCAATCRSLLSDYSLANELAFLDSNFKILLKFIDFFQKTSLSISLALELLNELERKFDLLTDKVERNFIKQNSSLQCYY